MTALINMSAAAQDIYERIGTGLILRIAHDSGAASFVNGSAGFLNCCVDGKAARELIEGRVLYKLAKDREGDQGGSRCGWEELGLDGNAADFWVHIQ
jgi:hypothetical protein